MKEKITLDCLEEPIGKVGRVLVDSFESGEFLGIIEKKGFGG
jgi:hypothetical protein